MLTGENGLLTSTMEAKEKTEAAQREENENFKKYEEELNKYMSGLPIREETAPYLPNNTFSVKEKDLNKGVVIEDNAGNEYVWIEVPKTIYENASYNNNGKNQPSSSEDWKKIRDCLKMYTSEYSSSDYKDSNVDGETYSDAYKKMLKSVYDNGGFWIGRYEAGIEGDNPRTQDDGNKMASDNVVIKPNMLPYNYIKRGEAQILAERMNYENCTSSLIYGIQWDLILKYIETKNVTTKDNLISNSIAIGNYRDNLWNITNPNAKYSIDEGQSFEPCPYQKQSIKEILLTTGADESFSLMNIYDIAGNVREWTQENFDTTNPSVARGGSYGNSNVEFSAKVRVSYSGDFFKEYIGFRIGLWK